MLRNAHSKEILVGFDSFGDLVGNFLCNLGYRAKNTIFIIVISYSLNIPYKKTIYPAKFT